MPKTKVTLEIVAKNPMDEALIAQALEKIAQHFSASELSKVAQKLESPIVRMKIKTML